MNIKKISFWVAVLFCACIFCACQATPLTQAVIGKQQGKIEEKIQEAEKTQEAEKIQNAETTQLAEPNYTYEAPTALNKKITSQSGTVDVNVDAEVVVPTEGPFPVLRITPHEISDEDANGIIKAFYGDNEVSVSRASTEATKQEIEEEILRLKRGDGSDLADVDRAAYDEMIAPDIAELEKAYQSAPDSIDEEPFDGSFKDQQQPTAVDPYPYALIYNDGVKTIDVTGNGLNGNSAQLIIEKDPQKFGAFEYVEQSAPGAMEICKPGDSVAESLETAQHLPNMPIEEARELANSLASSLGLGDFEIVEEGAALSGAYPEGLEEFQYADCPKCYAFFMTKKEALPINYASNIMNNVEYARAWPNEVLSVYIDDGGIKRVYYTSPSEEIETVSETVEILPFEEVEKLMEEYILRANEVLPEQVKSIVYNIKEIRLGLCRIAQSEDFTNCLLVPAWDIYGEYTTTYTDEVANTFELGLSFLTVNAIDGSLIDRSRGF